MISQMSETAGVIENRRAKAIVVPLSRIQHWDIENIFCLKATDH